MLVERPLTIVERLCIGRFGVGEHQFAVDIPAHLCFVPFQTIGVVAVEGGCLVSARLRIARILEVVGPVRVNGVPGTVLVVDGFPDVDFATTGPTCTLVLGHHPDGGEVANPGIREGAALHLSIREAKLAHRLDAARNHRYVIGGWVGVGDGADDEFAVLVIDHLGAVRAPAVPRGVHTLTAYPLRVVFLRSIFSVELVGKDQLVLRSIGRREIGRENHISVNAIGGNGEAISGNGVLAPLAVAVDILLALQIVATANGHLLSRKSCNSRRGHHVKFAISGQVVREGGIVRAVQASVGRVDAQAAVGLIDVDEEVHH